MIVVQGDLPSWTVFETEHSVAMLAPEPSVVGHAVLMPKQPWATMLSSNVSPQVFRPWGVEGKVATGFGVQAGVCRRGPRWVAPFSQCSPPQAPERMWGTLHPCNARPWFANANAGINL